MTLRVEPFEDRVLVRPIEESDVTKGGIILPTKSKEKPTKGVVLEVGPGKLLASGVLDTPRAAIDDVVIYSKYAGTEIEIEGQGCVILRSNDILCRIKEQ